MLVEREKSVLAILTPPQGISQGSLWLFKQIREKGPKRKPCSPDLVLGVTDFPTLYSILFIMFNIFSRGGDNTRTQILGDEHNWVPSVPGSF